MKLLLDQNLSHRLCAILSDTHLEFTHVKSLSLDKENDEKIWQYAKENNCVIISKDTDFLEMSIIKGLPPKVIWLNTGNAGTHDIENTFRRNIVKIKEFLVDNENALLILKT